MKLVLDLDYSAPLQVKWKQNLFSLLAFIAFCNKTNTVVKPNDFLFDRHHRVSFQSTSDRHTKQKCSLSGS